jgi:hypothetical protein
MNAPQWALVTRDVMQKVVEQLYGMGVLYGIQWVALGRVCRQWRHCINVLLSTLPASMTNSASYRTVLVGARRYLELALLRNYPHRIHALSNVSAHTSQTVSILAHILHQGCGINIFQLPLISHSMQTLLKFLGLYPSVYTLPTVRAAVEDHTGDLFLFVSRHEMVVPLDLASLRELETLLRTKDGKSVFVWHTYSLLHPNDHSQKTKRNFETTSLDAESFVFIFRNRDPDVNAGLEFDHEKRKVAKGLRKAVARKRSRPDRNVEEKRLIRMRMAQGAEVESISSDE